MKFLQKFDFFLELISLTTLHAKYQKILKERFLEDKELSEAFYKGNKAYQKSAAFYINALKTNNEADQKLSFPLFCVSSIVCMSVFQQRGAWNEANQIIDYLTEHLPSTQKDLKQELYAQRLINNFRLTLVDIEQQPLGATSTQKEDLAIYEVELQNFYQQKKTSNLLGEIALCQLAKNNTQDVALTFENLVGRSKDPIVDLKREVFENAGLFATVPKLGESYKYLLNYYLTQELSKKAIEKIETLNTKNTPQKPKI